MREAWRVAAGATLLLLAGCGSGERDSSARGVDRDETLLTLSASGEAEAVPDVALFEIGVETFTPSAQGANEANSRKAAEVVKALEAFKVEPRDMQTRSISLNRIDYGPRKGQFQAYNTISVRLKEVARAGEAIAAATAAGANIVSGPSLQIDDPEQANRGAYIAAYKAARTRAEAYAEASGKTIARVLAIRDGGEAGGREPYPPPIAYESAADAAAQVASPPPSVRAGVTRTRVSVQVDFALEDK